MGIDGIGSSVVVALAAVLWFVYLVPTWLKRREYLATERNAVRLQQTMRIMAESAELPAVVRVEATARTAAAQERALRQQRRRARALSLPLPEERAAHGGEGHFWPSRAASADRRLDGRTGRRDGSSRAARRLRRSRALATLVLLASLVAAGFGLSTVATSGSWLLLGASVIVASGALALLGQAAAVSRARAELRRVSRPVRAGSELHDDADFAETVRPGWTPVPVPTPLYLSRPAPVAGLARSDGSRGELVEAGALQHREVDHAAALRAAAAEAERALRTALSSPEVARIERPVAPPAAPAAESRFARMGRVDTADAAPADLDDILRRRRAVG